MTDLSLILTDLESARGAELLLLAERWARAGILKESIWIDRARWSSSPEATGVLIGAAGREDVEIQLAMAARDISTLRLLSLHLVGDEADAAGLVPAVDDWAIHSEYRQRASTVGTPFRCGAVVVAADRVCVPDHVFYAGWWFNLLVTAEDRLSDDHFPRDVAADILVAHALTAVATIGGLVAWADEAPVDRAAAPQVNEAKVRMVRPSIRMIDGGDLLDQVVDSVLELDAGARRWPLPAGLSPAPEAETEPVVAAARVAEDLSTARGLHFAPHRSPGPRPPDRLSLWKGLKLFLTTVGRILRDVPRWFVLQVRDRVEASVLTFFQEHTFGPDSQVVLTLRGRDAVGADAGNLATSRYRLVRDLGLPGTEAITAEPKLWEELQAVACGLVDGSELPDGVAPPMNGMVRSLITQPEHIVPRGDDAADFRPPQLPNVRLRSCDPLGAQELELYLRSVVDAVVDDEAEGPPPVIDTQQAAGALTALGSWRASEHRDTSFVWKVGETIATALGDASRELADALVVIAAGEPDQRESDDDRRRRTRLRRFVVTMFVLLAGGAAGLSWLVDDGRLSAAAGAGLGVAALLAWAGLVLHRFIRDATELARAQFARAAAIHRYYEAFNRAHVAAQGLTRFGALYWQYLDWASILGVVLHRPWGPAPPVEPPADIASLPRSLSFNVATGQLDADRFQQRVAAAQEVVIGPGWLSSTLGSLTARAMERYAILTNAIDAGRPDPTYDTAPTGMVVTAHAVTGEDIGTARGQLRADVRSGVDAAGLRADTAARVVESVLAEPVDAVFTSVAVDGDAAATQSGRTPLEFLGQIVPQGKPPAPFGRRFFGDESRAHPVVDLVVALPPGLPVEVGGWTRLVARPRAGYGRRLVLGAHRLDQSDPYPLPDLTAVTTAAPDGAGPPADGAVAVDGPRALDF